MEEKAPIAGQGTGTEREDNKMSYEDLMNFAVQLQQQNQQLQIQLRQNSGIEKRLYYLFEVVKYADYFGDFAKECVEEVKEILELPKDDKEDKPEPKQKNAKEGK